MNIEQPSEGEVLLLLCTRSGKSKTEIAQMLDIHPNHLSKLFKSEKLSIKIKLKAQSIFGVDLSIFTGKDIYAVPRVNPEFAEPELPYISSTLNLDSGCIEYIKEINQKHYDERAMLHSERARLLAIIENLTKK